MRSARLHSLLGITTDDSNMPDSADVIASPARKQKTENRHVVVDAVEDKVVEGESNYSKRTPSPPLAGNKKYEELRFIYKLLADLSRGC